MFIVKYRMDTHGKLTLITMAVVFFSISSLKVHADDDGGDADNEIQGSGVDRIYSTDCRKDKDCQTTQKCYRKKCINVCHLPRKLSKLQCSYAAVCYIPKPHTAGCQCLSGFTGDPYESGCEQIPIWNK